MTAAPTPAPGPGVPVLTLIAVPVQSPVLLPRVLPLARPWIQGSTPRRTA
ncbi:hypothetical protein [Deinococcus depolymerans]|uniref:Glycosyltransferase family 2 protein n=1 Tax=Deinococcus depolymerans TaxID=392408 RepID=A0ABP3LIB3_9DEIO